jgi:hypothetical protein
MNSFIHLTLMMLEDVGMFVRYPDVRQVTLDEDGKSTVHMSFSSMVGTRVNIEQNQPMKFMIIFALLDFYVDTSHPGMEGLSFSQKYKHLPSHGDFELIFRQLFRMAKLIRNSLVHNSSSFGIGDGHLDVDYTFRGTNFCLNMSTEALIDFYTAIVMFIKGDLGKGDYFLGIMRAIYRNILAGTKRFSDESGSELEECSDGLEIKPYVREIFTNPSYEISKGVIRFTTPKGKNLEWQPTAHPYRDET